ncbi:unnamed protein product, partial [Prorocentrum cordatum]
PRGCCAPISTAPARPGRGPGQAARRRGGRRRRRGVGAPRGGRWRRASGAARAVDGARGGRAGGAGRRRTGAAREGRRRCWRRRRCPVRAPGRGWLRATDRCRRAAPAQRPGGQFAPAPVGRVVRCCLAKLRDRSVEYGWVWRLDFCAGPVLCGDDRALCLQLRLGASVVPDSDACPELGGLVDCRDRARQGAQRGGPRRVRARTRSVAGPRSRATGLGGSEARRPAWRRLRDGGGAEPRGRGGRGDRRPRGRCRGGRLRGVRPPGQVRGPRQPRRRAGRGLLRQGPHAEGEDEPPGVLRRGGLRCAAREDGEALRAGARRPHLPGRPRAGRRRGGGPARGPERPGRQPRWR